MTDEERTIQALANWCRWVTKRRDIWSHVSVSGLAIESRGQWILVCSEAVLGDGEQSRNTAVSKLHDRVLTFSSIVSTENLAGFLDGLQRGGWAPEVLGADIPEIRLWPIAGRRLLATSEPRIEGPQPTAHSARPHLAWPRYALNLRGGAVNEWFAPDGYESFADLDERIRAQRAIGLPELAVKFGGVGNLGDHVSNLWNAAPQILLVAPLQLRIKRARVNASGEVIVEVDWTRTPVEAPSLVLVQPKVREVTLRGHS